MPSTLQNTQYAAFGKLKAAECVAYVISDDENVGEFGAHSGVVHGHERRVDDDAHRDEEVDERVHDEQLYDVCKRLPARWTVEPVDQFRVLPLQVVFPRQTLVEVQET